MSTDASVSVMNVELVVPTVVAVPACGDPDDFIGRRARTRVPCDRNGRGCHRRCDDVRRRIEWIERSAVFSERHKSCDSGCANANRKAAEDVVCGKRRRRCDPFASVTTGTDEANVPLAPDPAISAEKVTATPASGLELVSRTITFNGRYVPPIGTL